MILGHSWARYLLPVEGEVSPLTKKWKIRTVSISGAVLSSLEEPLLRHLTTRNKVTHLILVGMINDLTEKVIKYKDTAVLPCDTIDREHLRNRLIRLQRLAFERIPGLRICVLVESVPDLATYNRMRHPAYKHVAYPRFSDPIDRSILIKMKRNQDAADRIRTPRISMLYFIEIDKVIRNNPVLQEEYKKILQGSPTVNEEGKIYLDGLHPARDLVAATWIWIRNWIYRPPLVDPPKGGLRVDSFTHTSQGNTYAPPPAPSQGSIDS